LRVLHVITGLGLGGAEAILYRLCTFPGGEAINAVVSLNSEGAYGEPLRQAGVPVYALGMPRGRLTLSGLARLFRIVRSLRPDVVQTWLYHGNVVGGVTARFAGSRAIAWGLHASQLDPRKTGQKTLWVIKAGTLLSRLVPSRIISCSEQAAEVHIELGYSSEKISVVANGYCCDTFAPDPYKRRELREQLGLGEDQLVIGMVARYDPQKDHRNLIEALGYLGRSCRSLTCLLVGTGMETTNSEVVGLIANLGLLDTVRLLGPRKDIPDVMNALDVHVLSSAYGEAFPNVVAESMACGTPCVVTDVGDAPRIVGSTGWVVAPSDSRALAGAIEAALSACAHRAAWHGRQEACRARIVENFSLGRMVEGYESAWRQILGKT
jgi:glycosyltransferase involved in cell wall biosynthesis